MTPVVSERVGVRRAPMGARARRAVAGVAILALVLPIAAACTPRPTPSLGATPTTAPASGTPGVRAGARLVATVGGKIACASFPYGCAAALSILPAGTVVTEDWRPAASDPRWSPDYSKGFSTDHFNPAPVGSLPVIPRGTNRIVISLLGSYDTPSYNPDGSVATDLLARCSGDVEVGPATAAVNVRVTFRPDPASFRASCALVVSTEPG